MPVAFRTTFRCWPQQHIRGVISGWPHYGHRLIFAVTRRGHVRLVGPLPERSPLNIRTLGAIERDRYRVERLVYESRPGALRHGKPVSAEDGRRTVALPERPIHPIS